MRYRELLAGVVLAALLSTAPSASAAPLVQSVQDKGGDNVTAELPSQDDIGVWGFLGLTGLLGLLGLVRRRPRRVVVDPLQQANPLPPRTAIPKARGAHDAGDSWPSLAWPTEEPPQRPSPPAETAASAWPSAYPTPADSWRSRPPDEP